MRNGDDEIEVRVLGNSPATATELAIIPGSFKLRV